MFPRLRPAIARALVLALLGSCLAEASAAPPLPDPIQVRQMLMQRGIGNGVRITETDGTRATGILTAIRDDSFDLTSKDTFQAMTIPYAKVSKVQGGKSTLAKVGKGIGISAMVYVAVVVVAFIVIIAVQAGKG
jgi:hypothetical protein